MCNAVKAEGQYDSVISFERTPESSARYYFFARRHLKQYCGGSRIRNELLTESCTFMTEWWIYYKTTKRILHKQQLLRNISFNIFGHMANGHRLWRQRQSIKTLAPKPETGFTKERERRGIRSHDFSLANRITCLKICWQSWFEAKWRTSAQIQVCLQLPSTVSTVK